MIQTLIQNWWLLAVCGGLEAMIMVIYWMMLVATRGGRVALLGELARAAGICAVAAGMWRPARGRRWV